MVQMNVKEKLDQVIKETWLHDICQDYGKGKLIREASLKCSLYHHLSNRLCDFLEENNLFIYPEFHFPSLNYYADLAIVEMDMSIDSYYLSDRVTDYAAIIELKYDGGNSNTTVDFIKSDMKKIKNYVQNFNSDCQYYFGIIYETECSCLNWFDKRTTNHWGNGCLTELNAGIINDSTYFEVNSYNNMNLQQKREKCEIIW